MTDQPTFADLDYQGKKRKTRREEFLEGMEGLIPWGKLEERIRPHYFQGQRGRRTYPLSVMLRMHIVQLCYNLSDPAMEDLLYEAESVRRFAGLRLSKPIPDESTILYFRHLLEEHRLGQGLFEEIKGHLAEQGVRLKEGTIVDATIPSRGYGGAVVHQEQYWGAGPGDAAGEEREPVLFRVEAAHRGGRQDWDGPQHGGDSSQRA